MSFLHDIYSAIKPPPFDPDISSAETLGQCRGCGRLIWLQPNATDEASSSRDRLCWYCDDHSPQQDYYRG